jgi:lysylphosphatidylglycerol synthase-like protein
VETAIDVDLSRPQGLPKWLVPVLGAIVPAVLLLSGAKYLLQTAGWRLVLQRQARPPWPESVGATISGDALGYLTWAGPFTGEPIRAALIRESVPVAAGIAAGAIERMMYNLTAAGLVAAVFVGLLFGTSPPGRAIAWVAGAVGGALILAIGARRWATRRSSRRDRAMPVGPSSASKHRPGRGRAAFRAAAKELWRERRAVLPALALLCLLQHSLLVLEAYMMLEPSAQHRACGPHSSSKR